ncbi:MAG: hypothetical protein LBI99_09775, partial [Propionibacteriaceae bacterium]|nr:hypothetical protein [Propionibacteriaceae bacterium]
MILLNSAWLVAAFSSAEDEVSLRWAESQRVLSLNVGVPGQHRPTATKFMAVIVTECRRNGQIEMASYTRVHSQNCPIGAGYRLWPIRPA